LFKVIKLCNLKYCIMTNIPYAAAERRVWLDKSVDRSKLTNEYFKSALRIDAFLQNDWQLVADILSAEGFEATRDGLQKYIETWIEIMSPEYLMVKFRLLKSV